MPFDRPFGVLLQQRINCLQLSVSCRSGSSGSTSKLDLTSLPAGSNGCATAKNEQEKVSRDSMDGSNKERVILKGNKY